MSSSGVIKLSDTFLSENVEYPYLKVGSLNEVFGFGSKRYSFQKECLLYCDAYTYQNGSDIGPEMCVLFDLNNLENELEAVLSEGYGAGIFYGRRITSFTVGEQQGRVYSREAARCPGLFCTVVSPLTRFWWKAICSFISDAFCHAGDFRLLCMACLPGEQKLLYAHRPILEQIGERRGRSGKSGIGGGYRRE